MVDAESGALSREPSPPSARRGTIMVATGELGHSKEGLRRSASMGCGASMAAGGSGGGGLGGGAKPPSPPRRQSSSLTKALSTSAGRRSSSGCTGSGGEAASAHVTMGEEALELVHWWRVRDCGLISVAFVERGRLIVAASSDGAATLWTLLGIQVGTFGQPLPWELSNTCSYASDVPLSHHTLPVSEMGFATIPRWLHPSLCRLLALMLLFVCVVCVGWLCCCCYSCSRLLHPLTPAPSLTPVPGAHGDGSRGKGTPGRHEAALGQRAFQLRSD